MEKISSKLSLVLLFTLGTGFLYAKEKPSKVEKIDTGLSKKHEKFILEQIQSLAKRWGKKKYKYSSLPGGPRGVQADFDVVLKVSEDKESKNHLFMELSMKGKYRSGKMELSISNTCKKNLYLSAIKIYIKGNLEPGEEKIDLEINIKDGKATFEIEGKKQSREIPYDTITSTAMYFLVTCFPFDEDFELEFSSLEDMEMNLKSDHFITCIGEETIELNDKEIKAWKYERTGSRIRPAYYWVDSDHRLVRVLIDGYKEIKLQQEKKEGEK